MGVPDQNLPNWGGALGKLATAIKATARAIDESTNSDTTVQVEHGGNGELRIGTFGASGGGGGGGGGISDLYGFKVWVDDQGHVQVAAGTAQIWGGAVKTYAAADLGAKGSGGHVYVVCDLTVSPPEWDNQFWYGDDLEDYNPDEELRVPIALVSVSNGVATVTQMHWGNIVVPATANVVDVQEDAAAEEEEE